MARRVLIADDVALFRTALKDILESTGYDVVGDASNGADAVEKARALKPDIVILDVVMPVKNGLEAAKEISLLNLPVKIVMCTSLGYELIVEEAIQSGASAYIMKPLNRDSVLEALKSLE
ncbi:MAG: response regulator [Deltaproteobacteria bacterium]|nr:response regulator [Deltaproteobacteria bacterium]